MLLEQVEKTDNKKEKEKKEGKIGYFLLPSDIEVFDFEEAKKAGCSDVILPIEDPSKARNFVAACHEHRMRAHAWINCYRHRDRWYDPDEIEPVTRAQQLIETALRACCFDGIFLDDLRYPKNLEENQKSYQKINRAALELNGVIKAIDSRALTIIGVMPKMERTYKLYGQCSPCLSAYSDIQVPLTFTDKKATDASFIEEVTRWTVEKSGKAVWTAVTTFEDEEEIVPASQTQLKKLIGAAERGGASKVLLYHYSMSLL